MQRQKNVALQGELLKAIRRNYRVYTLCPKNHPDIFSCNLNKHYLSFIIFAHTVLRDWEIKRWFIFPPHLNSVSTLPGKTNTKSHLFTQMPR